MNQDAAFIADIVAHPEDTHLRDIYADWLEDQGDPRADYLRLQSQIEALPEKTRDRKKLLARLRELRPTLDPNWVAALDRTWIEQCATEAECPKRWENLTPTEEPTVRFCESCRQLVYYCENVEAAREHADAGHCLAVDSSVPRRQGDTRLRGRTWVGRVVVDLAVLRLYPPGTLVVITATEHRGQKGLVEEVDPGTGLATVRIRGGGTFRRVLVALEALDSL